MKKYFAEAICSALLIFIGCWCSSLLYENIGVLGVGLGFGLTYILCFYTLGKLSGCHLNPVISFAYYLTKRIEIKEFWFYVLSQCIGAICGSVVLTILLFLCPEAASVVGSGGWFNSYGSVSPSEISVFGAIIVEVVITFVFAMVFMIVQFKNNSKLCSGLIIGLTYVIVVAFAFKLTGACLNPARCLGPALVGIFTNGLTYILQFPVFLIATFIGCVLALICYKNLYNKDSEDLRISWLNFKK